MSGNADGNGARRFHRLSAYRRRPEFAGATEEIGTGEPPDMVPAIWERDWSVEPFPFKVYTTAPVIELPAAETQLPAPPALDVLDGTVSTPASGSAPDLATLARLARYAAGQLDRPVPGRDGNVHRFRAAGGTGARYHLELYVVCGPLADLPAGVYHYSAYDDTLRRLRTGDFRPLLIEATGSEPAVAAAPMVAVLTSTFWRNAWRYRERAYRHTFWDAGTTLSQLVAVAGSAGLAAKVVLGYADEQVNALLDVDGVREAAVAVCPLGRRAPEGDPARTTPSVEPLGLPTRAISAWEESFPEIPRVHAVTGLASGAEAARWRVAGPPADSSLPAPTGELIRLAPTGAGSSVDRRAADPTVEDVIRRRRSVRHYDAERPTSYADFSALLRISAGGFSADCLSPGERPYRLYLIVNSVEDLAPGLYVHHPERDAVELLRAGDFRRDAQRIAVEQEYPARAHVNLYYLADLEVVYAAYGDRGYRLAQLAAALDAGRLHLATQLLGCGAVGSTAYDEEVVDLFSPHAAGLSYLFVTVFGRRRPARR